MREYLKSGYEDNLKVTPLPNWDPFNVPEIFTPVVLVGDNKEKLRSYKDLFYKENDLQKKIMLLGKAGAGKTTLCAHLTDVWCNPTAKGQFDDVDVLRRFQFLFHVSCRHAENKETILDMIKNQLFPDDEELKGIACRMLKAYPESCLIILDGYDEWKRSAEADTGKRGDIKGVPSMVGVQNNVLFITTRPWRFHELEQNTRNLFSRLELDGIKDEKILIKKALENLKDKDPEKSCSVFLDQVKKNNMLDLLKFPLMLMFLVDIWECDKSLHKSRTINYIKMTESLVRRAEKNRESVSDELTLNYVKKLQDKWFAKTLPGVFSMSRVEYIPNYAGLLLSLGHLASDLLLGQKEQSLVFHKDVCKDYNINEGDRSLKVCLDLGLLTKLESTMRGKKKFENMQFYHKTFQEFFGALWIASNYEKEKSKLYQCVKTISNVLDYSTLIVFMCGLCPEAGAEFWRYVAVEVIEKDEDLMKWRNSGIIRYCISSISIQGLILKAVREARDCSDQQTKQVYYCLPDVVLDTDTPDEDIPLICDMQNHTDYMKSLDIYRVESLSSPQLDSICRSVSCATHLQSLSLINGSSMSNPQWDSICRSVSCVTHLQSLSLNIVSSMSSAQWDSRCKSVSCATHLQSLSLKIDSSSMSSPQWDSICRSVSCVTHLQSLSLNIVSSMSSPQWDSRCKSVSCATHLQSLSLKIDSSSMSSPQWDSICRSVSCATHLQKLSLTVFNKSWSTQISGPGLDLQNHHRLERLELDNLPVSGLVLPGQEESPLREVRLEKLVLSHDSLVKVCGSLSSCSGLWYLWLSRLSCSDQSGNCLPVLDLQNCHRLERLYLGDLPVSGLVLPGQEVTTQVPGTE